MIPVCFALCLIRIMLYGRWIEVNDLLLMCIVNRRGRGDWDVVDKF